MACIIMGEIIKRRPIEEEQSRHLDPNDIRKWHMCRMDSFLGNSLLYLSVTQMLCYKHVLMAGNKTREIRTRGTWGTSDAAVWPIHKQNHPVKKKK